MLHIIIGTKAQFIKMAPLMKGLESRGIPYNFINLGQHGATVERLKEQFGVQQNPPSPLFGEGQGEGQKDIVSLPGMFKWLANHLMTVAFRKQYLKDEIFKGQSGVALIHGDTLSTLIGLLMAKRAGLKVAHVESGLMSWNYLHPFPEEIIRVICMRYSDYLFAPSDEAVENLKRMKVKVEVEGKRRIFNTGGNTGMDAVKMTLQGSGAYGHTPSEPYVLASIHRFENLYSRKRFRFILDTVNEVSKRFNVVFVMHGPTEKKLKAKGRWGDGEKGRSDAPIRYIPLQDYPTFLHLIRDAEFVVTDGGSVQEECFYLGKPCLIMRKRTERNDGIGENAVLCGFNMDTVDAFVSSYNNYRVKKSFSEVTPSDKVIGVLLTLV